MIDPVGCDSEQTLAQTEAKQRLRALMLRMLQFISSVEAETSRGFTAWLTLESYAAQTESSLHALMQRLVAAQALERRINLGILCDDLRQAAGDSAPALPRSTTNHKDVHQREVVDDWLRIVQQAIDNLHDLASGVHLMSVNEARAVPAVPRQTV